MKNKKIFIPPKMYKRKRYAYDVAKQAAKRRRVTPGTTRATYRRPKQRMYVARTPGGQILAESHYFDTERTVTAIAANTATWTNTEYDPNTTAMLCLFAPVQGDDISQRNGRKIFVKKIKINGQITCNAQNAVNTLDAGSNIRIIVFMDKQTNAAQAQGEDVIGSGAGSDAIHQFQNPANFGRFKVFKDKFFIMQNPVATGPNPAIEQAGLVKNFKFTLKPRVWVNYNAGVTGTISDVVDNSFHLLANCTNAQLAPNITYKVRTVFSP